MSSFSIWLPDEGPGMMSSDDLTAELPDELGSKIRSHAKSDATWRREPAGAITRASLDEARRCRPVPAPLEPGDLRKVDGTQQTNRPIVKLGKLVIAESKSLAENLTQRRSERNLGAPPLEGLASILVRTSRVWEWRRGSDGYVETHRPTPSAGGRHPIDLLLAVQGVEGLTDGWWGFDPMLCGLAASKDGPPVGSFLEDLAEIAHSSTRPSAVIVLVARFARTLDRYPAGTSLVWRDAGVLAGYLHLCATDVGLGSCILGTSGLLDLDTDQLISADVGCVLIGTSTSS